MMTKRNGEESKILRKKAESELLKRRKIKQGAPLKSDSMKLVHELQVHQIELEMQNEELKKARNEAEIALEKYNSLYEFAPSGYFSLTKTGEIREVNLQGTILLGVARSRLINRNFKSFLKWNCISTFEYFMQKIVSDSPNAWCEVELSLLQKNGGGGFQFHGDVEVGGLQKAGFRPDDEVFKTPRYLFLEGNSSNQNGSFQIVAVDITRRKMAEDALEKTRFHRAILDHMPCAAMLIQPDFTVVAANPLARKNGAIIGSRCYETMSENRRPCSWCRLTEVMKSQSPQHLEVRIGDKSCDMHWIPINPEMGLKFYYDVTEKKETERALVQARLSAEKASRAKSEFLSNMSHELRTPLNAILGFSQLLRSENLTVEQKEFVDIVLKSGSDLLALISDILDLARIEAEKMPVSHKTFHLPSLLRELPSFIQTQIRKKGLKYEQGSDPQIPDQLVGDPQRLKQILLNLLVNAVKFTEKGKVSLNVKLAPQFPTDGEVFIENRLDRRGGPPCPPKKILPEKKNRVWVQFSVSDTGIGISPEFLNTIFEPFTQVETADTRKYGGAGLGLNICKRLAGLMQGEICVESTPGLGSSFHLLCPFETADQQVKPVKNRAQALPDDFLKSWHILVVDNDPQSLCLLRHFCDPLGCKMTAFENGARVIDYFKTQTVDLILLDLQMPGIDGYELSMGIRALEKERGTKERHPIFAVTANLLDEVRERCIAAQIDEIITKPFTRDHLFKRILPYFLKEKTNFLGSS